MSMAAGHSALVTFFVAENEFALPLDEVDEVIPLVDLVAVPDASDSMAGVANVRGTLIPVVDLASRLHLPPTKISLSVPIVLVHHEGSSYGLLVNNLGSVVAATEVAEFDLHAAEWACVHEAIEIGGRTVLLLDLDACLHETKQLLLSPEVS